MRKVCFLSGDITRSGGTEKVACQIMNGLIHSYDVSVISLTESNSEMFYSLDAKVKHKALFDYNPNGVSKFISIVSRIHRFLKDNDIDVLVDIDTILDMFSVFAVNGLKTQLISWEHFNFYETLGNKLRVPIRKYMTRWSDCVVTLTLEDQRNYKEYFGDKLRVEQIYNPIELSNDGYHYDVDSKLIISAGRLSYQKGFDMLVEIAEKVFERYSDWQWLILGEGDERNHLERLIKEKKLSQVRLMGNVSNIADYLSKSSIFVLTSRYEGFPLVLIEAKAHNLPIVSFDCKTGPAELVQNNVNGFIVNCFDTSLMAQKICELIEHSDLREEYARKAMLDIEKLKYEEILGQWTKLIENLA